MIKKKSGLFPALCSNGNLDIYQMFTEDEISECMEETWDGLYPIHIVSVFHNYNLLDNVIKTPENVNMFSIDGMKWTPLVVASVIGTQKVEKSRQTDFTESDQRDKTVRCLIQKGAEVNICNIYGISSLWLACYNGNESTAQILLNNGADVNLCDKDGISPLWIAYCNGHEDTVQLLLSNGAKVNQCNKDGVSPLCIVCENGHLSTAKL